MHVGPNAQGVVFDIYWRISNGDKIFMIFDVQTVGFQHRLQLFSFIAPSIPNHNSIELVSSWLVVRSTSAFIQKYQSKGNASASQTYFNETKSSWQTPVLVGSIRIGVMSKSKNPWRTHPSLESSSMECSLYSQCLVSTFASAPSQFKYSSKIIQRISWTFYFLPCFCTFRRLLLQP